MRFESIKIRNLGPFTDASIDLSAIDGKIIAVSGSNGSGKSTLLELLAAAIYRTTPTRGKLIDLATGRDSFVEVKATNGASYTIRHSVDSHSRKGESLVLDASGVPVLPSGKVAEFDKWAAIHLPSPDVFYSSTFSAQGSGGFLEMKPGDRKAVLLRVLGIERLEGLAQSARDRARDTQQSLAVITARIEDEAKRHGNISDLEQELEASLSRLGGVTRSLEDARNELAELQTQVEEVKKQQAIAKEQNKLINDLSNQRLEHLGAIQDLENRIGNNRLVIADEKQIREASLEHTELQVKLEELKAEHAASMTIMARLSLTADHCTQLITQIQKQISVERRTVQVTEALLAHQDEVTKAVESLDGLKAELAEQHRAFCDAKSDTQALEDKRSGGLRTRVENLRKGLEGVVNWRAECHAYDDDMGHPRRGFDEEEIERLELHTKEYLANDDAEAELQKQLPKLITEARRSVMEAGNAVEITTHKLHMAELTAAKAPELDLARLDLEVARSALNDLVAELGSAERIGRETFAKRVECGDLVRQQKNIMCLANTRLEAASKDAKRMVYLEKAETRLEELEPQLEVLNRKIQDIDTEMSGFTPISPVHAPDTTETVWYVTEKESELKKVEVEVIISRNKLDAAHQGVVMVESMVQDQRVIEAELGDWNKLAADLGRNGLQAYEVDAVGGELTELVNDLLRTCVSSRWTVSIETQRNSADGKRTIEGCEVRVIDTERGREAPAESLSGGERVLVSEAISLALSMLACRRSGVEGPTLIRDETGAALDPEKSMAYVAMLRRAADIVGASQVLFVNHSLDIRAWADAKIFIQEGVIE